MSRLNILIENGHESYEVTFPVYQVITAREAFSGGERSLWGALVGPGCSIADQLLALSMLARKIEELPPPSNDQL